MRRALTAVLSLALASMACGERGERASESEAVPDSLRYGGTIVVASLMEAHSMNPLASTDDISQDMQTFLLFTPLIRYNDELEPVPHLAESWDTATSGDDMVLTFRLRDDVKWHDGTPTTAHDVAFTFERIKDPSTGYPRASLFALYDSAVVQDSFTISFHLKRHAGYMDPWRTTPPIPAHILGDVPPAALRDHRFGTEDPVGNGPFRFVEHRSGDRWVFEVNREFPEELGGRPHVDRLVYRYIEEPTTRLAEFLAGDVDVYLIVAPSQIEEIEKHAETRLVRYANRNYAFINWNERRPFFKDAAVRRALTLAIDRQEIVDFVQHGLGQVATGPVPPFHWAYDPDLEPLPYDPESARALLDSAGWIDRDGDGVRERGDVRASFELTTNAGNPAREDILTLVQAKLAQLGVEVRTRTQEAQSLRANITSPERRFDAFVLGWSADFNLDDRRLFACSQLDGVFQWAGYCNARVDEILEQVIPMEDRAAAMPLWREYQRIMQHDQPYTFLYYDVRANAVRSRVKSVEMDIRGDFTNAGDWWIEPASRRR
jgi:peptide/nickel transport system substrate-binding protein